MVFLLPDVPAVFEKMAPLFVQDVGVGAAEPAPKLESMKRRWNCPFRVTSPRLDSRSNPFAPSRRERETAGKAAPTGSRCVAVR